MNFDIIDNLYKYIYVYISIYTSIRNSSRDFGRVQIEVKPKNSLDPERNKSIEPVLRVKREIGVKIGFLKLV